MEKINLKKIIFEQIFRIADRDIKRSELILKKLNKISRVYLINEMDFFIRTMVSCKKRPNLSWFLLERIKEYANKILESDVFLVQELNADSFIYTKLNKNELDKIVNEKKDNIINSFYQDFLTFCLNNHCVINYD